MYGHVGGRMTVTSMMDSLFLVEAAARTGRRMLSIRLVDP